MPDRRAAFGLLRTALAALLLGSLIWYISRNELSGQEEVRALVQVVDAGDARVEGESGQAPTVRVLLTGPMGPLERVRGEIERQRLVGRVRLDPQQLSAGGALTVPLTESVFPPLDERDARVRLRLIDREIRLLVTPMETRLLPVNLVSDLDPSRFSRYSVELYPSQVEVRGPKAVVGTLNAASTERLELAREVDAGQRDIQRSVAIDTSVNGRRFECSDRVWVHLKIGEELVTQTFDDVPIRILLPPDFPFDVRIARPDERTTTVVVRGPRSLVTGDPQLAQKVLVFLVVGSPREFRPAPTPYLIERQHRLPAGLEAVGMTGPDKISVDILERKPAATPP
jgi:hypothetical protein